MDGYCVFSHCMSFDQFMEFVSDHITVDCVLLKVCISQLT